MTAEYISLSEVTDTADMVVGRAMRELNAAVHDFDGMVTHHHWQHRDGRDFHRIVVQCIPDRPCKQLHEDGEQLLDVIDRVRDRLVLEEWDQ